MRVIIKEPNKKPYEAEIGKRLSDLQKAVGGYVESFTLIPGELIILCNDEGRIKNLPFNCCVCGSDFYGTIIFAGSEKESFSDVGFSMNTFKNVFWYLFK